MSVLTLAALGLAAGLMLATALRGSYQLTLPYAAYVEEKQALLRRSASWMPVVMHLLAAAEAVLAVAERRQPAGTLYVVGAAALVAVLLVSHFRNSPINRWVATLPVHTAPLDWKEIDPRRSWTRWHLARTAATLLALAVNAAALALPT
ncbi:anthrone oxygenase family protein [Nonomuraea monospora]